MITGSMLYDLIIARIGWRWICLPIPPTEMKSVPSSGCCAEREPATSRASLARLVFHLFHPMRSVDLYTTLFRIRLPKLG